MKLTGIIYKHGHFYDPATRQRIIIRNGAVLTIDVKQDDVLPFEPVGKQNRSGKELKEKYALFGLLDKCAKEGKDFINLGDTRYNKIFNKGKHVYFALKRRKGSRIITHEFKVELLDDLYFYLKKGKEEERLLDCDCVVRENTSKTLDFFEEIHGKSLSQVFKNTYVHFFENKGAPSGNAIARFYEEAGKEKLPIELYRKPADAKNNSSIYDKNGLLEVAVL
jgi:hypothetical protein